MRKREFVGIFAIGAAFICLLAFLFSKHGFRRGYKERDNDMKKYA